MMLDLATAATPERLETDICIVGAGAAGIPLALTLGRRGRRVMLLEAGDHDFDPAVQDAYAGDTVGRPYFDLTETRMRLFGGSTNKWSGWCRELAAVDFESREHLPEHGWPFGLDELKPYYAAAHPLLELGPPTYEVDFWERALGREPLSLGPRIGTSVLQFSPPTLLGPAYRDELERLPTVTVVLNAPVIDMRTDGAGRLDRVEVAAPGARRLPVRAGHFVLACGGIENPRLLLNAVADNPAGLGNSNGLVGRFFNDHVTIDHSGLLMLSPATNIDQYIRTRAAAVPRERLPGLAPGAPVPVQYFLTPDPDVLRREGLTNVALHMKPRTYRSEIRWSGEAAIALARGVARWDVRNEAAYHLDKARRHADSLMPALMQTFGIGGIGPDEHRMAFLKAIVEQTPNWHSRVTLGDEVDRHGLRRARLDWQWSEVDKRSAVRFHEILAEELGAAGIGRLHINLPDDAVSLGTWEARTDTVMEHPPIVSAGHHHLCTTRMHDDPGRGVVDRNCRVHELENLFIAGSSSFATGGLWNPTLTIVALSLRLADHLEALR